MLERVESPRIQVRSEFTVPRIILGCWQLSQGHSTTRPDKDELFNAFDRAIEVGLNTFDCADIYTGVEALLGEYIRRYRMRHGREKAHEAIQIHTKFVPDLSLLPRIRREDVRRAIDRSRRRLDVEQISLVQFAWWDYEVPNYVDAAAWLSELIEEGSIAQVGATNFDSRRLAELLAADVPIAVHQVQYSLLDQRAAASMTELCAAHDIWLLCYGTIAGGLLNERYLDMPEPVEPLQNRSLRKYKLIVREFGGWSLFQELLHVLHGIARQRQCTIATVAMQYVLAQKRVAAAILGTRSPIEYGQLVSTLAEPITEGEMETIHSVLRRATGPKGEVFELERDRNGPHGKIMRYNLNSGDV